MSIHLAGSVDQGVFRLDAELDVAAGARLALLGMNGAGKSTLLRTLAGLSPLTAGRLELDGRTVDDPEAGVFVEPEHRAVGYVPQDATLFPHLTAEANIAFGPRSHARPRAEARQVAADWLTRVGLEGIGARRADELSGGEARRVALARALAVEPEVLLLDEPLASLDVDARNGLRRLLRDEHVTAERTTVLVTHDPVEALASADQVAVIESGRVLQSGSPDEVLARPRSAFVARLVGLNLLEGSGRGRVLEVDGGGVVQAAERVPSRALATVPPRAVTLHRSEPEGSARNVWTVTVAGVEPVDDRVRVRLEGELALVAEVTSAAAAELDVTPGQQVWASLKATEVDVFPA